MHSCDFCNPSDVRLASITTGQLFCLNCSWRTLLFSLVPCQASEDVKNGSSGKDSWIFLDVYSKYYAVVAQRSTSFSFKKKWIWTVWDEHVRLFISLKGFVNVLNLRSSLFLFFTSHSCLVLHLLVFFFFVWKSLWIPFCSERVVIKIPESSGLASLLQFPLLPSYVTNNASIFTSPLTV